MLARGNRITRGTDYRTVVRGGARCVGLASITYIQQTGEPREPRFGFIINKKVGSAVVRNTVRRRMKAAAADLLPSLPSGVDIVMRALPASARVTFHQIHTDLARCLRKKLPG